MVRCVVLISFCVICSPLGKMFLHLQRISKKYVFQPVEILVDKEGSSHIYGLTNQEIDSKDLNDDYYIDKDFEEQTEGKYKSETNKSLSKFNGRSFADGDVKEEQKYKRKNY